MSSGGFMGARVYSLYTAMLIKADLEGLLDGRVVDFAAIGRTSWADGVQLSGLSRSTVR